MRAEVYRAIELLVRADDTITRAERETIRATLQPMVERGVVNLPDGFGQRAHPGYIRHKEAAEYLGIGARTLSSWKARGKLPYHKLSHKLCLYKKADLDRAISRFRVMAIGESPEDRGSPV